MSVEFSNAYQEVLLENIDAILKQNFIFQTKLKLFEKEANNRAELQAKVNELTELYQDSLARINKAEQYKSRAESSDAIVQEKTRIQSALNDSMKKVATLSMSLETTEKELSELKDYVSKLESIVPVTKLRKINTVKVEELKPEEPAPVDLLAFKVEDGSTF